MRILGLSRIIRGCDCARLCCYRLLLRPALAAAIIRRPVPQRKLGRWLRSPRRRSGSARRPFLTARSSRHLRRRSQTFGPLRWGVLPRYPATLPVDLRGMRFHPGPRRGRPLGARLLAALATPSTVPVQMPQRCGSKASAGLAVRSQTGRCQSHRCVAEVTGTYLTSSNRFGFVRVLQP